MKYRSFVHQACDEQYLTFLKLTNIRDTLINSEYFFQYDLNPTYNEIELQGELFAQKLVTETVHNNSLAKVVRLGNMENLINNVRDSYVYSYLKVLFYVTQMYESGHNMQNVAVPGRSFAYHGHNVLYNSLCKKYHRTTLISNRTTLIRRLDLYREVLGDDITNSGIWNRATSGPMGSRDFFLPEYEFTMSSIKDMFNHVHVDSFGETGAMFGDDPESNPIGNCVFSGEDRNLVSCITDHRLVNDDISKHWNTACCVRLLEEDVLPGNGSVFMSVPTSDLDDETLKYKVQAITGLDMYGLSYGTGNGNNTSSVDDTLSNGPSGGSNKGPKNNGGNRTSTRLNAAKGKGGNPLISGTRKVAGALGKTGKNVFQSDTFGAFIKHALQRQLDADNRRALIEAAQDFGININSDNIDFKTGLPLLEHKGGKSSTNINIEKKSNN